MSGDTEAVRSRTPVETYDMAILMADVIGLIDALGEDRAILKALFSSL
jgi:hypothetical protein